jgi:hypothetical protein
VVGVGSVEAEFHMISFGDQAKGFLQTGDGLEVMLSVVVLN